MSHEQPHLTREEDYKAWLSADTDAPLKTLGHGRGSELHGYKVSRAVNSSRNDDADFIEPIDTQRTG